MMTRRSLWRAGAVALSSVGITACALILDWDAAGLLCDDQKRCARGYSCLINRCVEIGTLAPGDTCSEDEQCAGDPDIICGSNPFTCRTRCGVGGNDLYGAPGDCAANEFCRPEISRTFEDQWVGTCYASECARDDQCDSDRICVRISQTAGACLSACDYSFATGSYSDSCGSSGDIEQYCQPIGPTGAQTLVCLQAIGARASLGGPCSPVANPCQSGAVCVGGVCLLYCGDGGGCASGYCQDYVNDGDDGAVLFSACID